MNTIDYILDRLPSYYNTSEESNIYNIINSITYEVDLIHQMTIYLDQLMDLDTTYNNDLDVIWGRILGITRYNNESDDRYRLRLKMAFLSQKGGTADILQYAVANALSIPTNSKSYLDSVIQIEDAWKYDNVVDNTYGCAVCRINTSLINITSENIIYINETLDRCKASGVKFNVILTMMKFNSEIKVESILKNVVTTPAQFPIKFATTFGNITERRL